MAEIEKYHPEGCCKRMLYCQLWWMLRARDDIESNTPFGKRVKHSRKQIKWKPEINRTTSALRFLMRCNTSAPFDCNHSIRVPLCCSTLSIEILTCVSFFFSFSFFFLTGDQAAAMSRKNNAQGIFLCGSKLTLVHLFSVLHLCFTINLTSR